MERDKLDKFIYNNYLNDTLKEYVKLEHLQPLITKMGNDFMVELDEQIEVLMKDINEYEPSHISLNDVYDNPGFFSKFCKDLNSYISLDLNQTLPNREEYHEEFCEVVKIVRDIEH